MRSVRWSSLFVLFVLGALVVACGQTERETPVQQPEAETGDMDFANAHDTLTIVLEENKSPKPFKLKLKKNTTLEHCRWQNKTAIPRTIHFKSDWPFLEAQEDITVPANGYSAWYSLNGAALAKGYAYEVIPALESTTPPDEPSISVEE